MARSTSIAPYPAPHDRTARRLEWAFLPPHLRAWIERRCGSPVVSAISQTSGFTPGFASVLVCEDGSRHFVKAASVKAQRMFADSYREEARKLAALPAGVPAPRLLWHLDDDWVVLGIEYVAARPPHRPWQAEDLDALLDSLEVVRRRADPAPAGAGPRHRGRRLRPAPRGLAGAPRAAYGPRRRRTWPRPRRWRGATPRWSAATPWSTPTSAPTTCSSTPTGRALVCDWNWPVRGAAWFDSFAALIGPRGEGIDVDAVIAERRLLRDVDPEAFDINLALYVGYFFTQCELPVPPTSPHLRDHQRWQGEVCWDWLAERRGWS